MEILENPIVKEALKWLILVGVGLILGSIRRMNRKIIYIEYKLIATDYALEKSFKNGYANHRDSKLNELLTKSNFINKNKDA